MDLAVDLPQDLGEQGFRSSHLGKLERDVTTIPEHLGADLDQLFARVVSDQCATSLGSVNFRL